MVRLVSKRMQSFGPVDWVGGDFRGAGYRAFSAVLGGCSVKGEPCNSPVSPDCYEYPFTASDPVGNALGVGCGVALSPRTPYRQKAVELVWWRGGFSGALPGAFNRSLRVQRQALPGCGREAHGFMPLGRVFLGFWGKLTSFYAGCRIWVS